MKELSLSRIAGLLPRVRIFSLVVAGAMTATVVSANASSFNYTFPDGSGGFALLSRGGPVNPGVLVGFNPQSEPPGDRPTDLSLSNASSPVLTQAPPNACDGSVCPAPTYQFVMSFLGIGSPTFTSAAMPDARGNTSFQFTVDGSGGPHQFEVLLNIALDFSATVQSWSWGAFNPQPEPPGDFIAFQFTPSAAVDPQVTFSVLEDSSPLQFRLAATPIPAALPLFASGLAGLGLLGWRRRRRTVAAIAV